MKSAVHPLQKYLPTIIRIMNSTGDLTMVEAPSCFPFPKAYPGQVTAVKELLENDNVLISSPTGSGKTAVFLSGTTGRPSVIIEARKFLQQQVGAYRNDCVIFGRSAYPCHWEENAADAPCRGKKETYMIGDKPVKFFRAFNEKTGKEEMVEYPCKEGCAYNNAVKDAIDTIRGGGTVITNFGNFWPYLQYATYIGIDEADLFFVSISSATRLKFVEDLAPTTKETIEREVEGAKKEYDSLMKVKPRGKDDSRSLSRRIDKIKNHYLSMKGKLENHDICFQYSKYNKQTGRMNCYIEIRPDKVDMLKDRMFPVVSEDGVRRKIALATATPGNFTADKVISYSVFMRTAIFYSPVALMTATYTRNHPEAFEQCATFVQKTHEGFKRLMGDGGKKTIIHCGSLANAQQMSILLGRENCDVHTTGKLMEIIEKFKTSPQEYLLVTAAEYGANIDYASHQYSLKVPFASFDEKLQCLQNEMGESKFSEWYALDALYRIVQQSGRVGRGAGGLGFTFILDRKFAELYGRYEKKLPQAFKDAIARGGTL